MTSVAIDLQTGRLRRATRAASSSRDCSTRWRRSRHSTAPSLAFNVPMSLVDNASRATNIEGYAPRTDEDMLFLYNIVSPDYFRTLRIPLLAGRELHANR